MVCKRLWLVKMTGTGNHYGSGPPEDSGIFYVVADTPGRAARLVKEAYTRWEEAKAASAVLTEDGSLRKQPAGPTFSEPRVMEVLTDNLVSEYNP